jgi:GH25 family lysozyme M1 (1,4-beta-N-acetylmuramidase)
MRSKICLAIASFASLYATFAVAGSAFNEPWRDQSRALVIDAYEHNSVDWAKMTTEKRVVGFINKATDGDGERWNCTDPDTSLEVCRLKFRRYFVAQELYQTRRMLAKSLGLKWGSYHLGRKGNPIAQADHYLAMAKPTDDEVMALDIEGLEDKWMSLEDAQKFVVRIHDKTGRYPMLYVNGSTAKHIADNRADYRILSRLQLWYARFSPEIDGHFPKGNWDKYSIWQFSATPNCNERRCPQRVPGTPNDIDVNVADMTPDALRAAWPMDDLVAEKPLPVQPVEVVEPLLVAANAPEATLAQTATAALDQPETLPAQPEVAAPVNIKSAKAETSVAGIEMVPLPSSAPRQTNERPKTTFVAMANIFGSGGMAFTSTTGHSHGTAEIFALIGITDTPNLAVMQPREPLDLIPVVSIPRIWPAATKQIDEREAMAVLPPRIPTVSGPN